MDRKHVVASIEQRLERWREMEAAADEAETQLKAAGQAGASPTYRDLLLRARTLRELADREFAAITRSVHLDEDTRDR